MTATNIFRAPSIFRLEILRDGKHVALLAGHHAHEVLTRAQAAYGADQWRWVDQHMRPIVGAANVAG
ncbi:hypothetical protein [Cupriavidus basilensis]|uniref:hypothetical protein n=1 Tax=Cupriavidus basilensis TaxID=68895 RepID=UPI0039F65F4C